MLFTDMSSTDLLLHITAIKRWFVFTVLLNMLTTNLRSSGKQFDRIIKIIIVVCKYLFSAKVNTTTPTAIL